jgi:SM-20-related protein
LAEQARHVEPFNLIDRIEEAHLAHLELEKLRQARVETQPYNYTIVPAFIGPSTVAQVNATYPKIEQGGSYPIESLDAGMAIKDVIDELDSPAFEALISEKFQVDLAGRPKMYSLRGYTRAKDGQIHTDSKDKIITVLLYLNENWTHAGGKLRVLKNGHNVDDYVTEVAPDNGTLLVFKRAENSWHGHHPFDGQRRSLQMNWMTSEGSKGFHAIRHKISAVVKKLTAV